MGKIYKNDIGTKIILNLGVDMSGASVRQIKYTKPGRISGNWAATLGADDKSIYYLTVDGDLDEIGRWTVQAYIESSSWTGHGESVSFQVLAHI